MENFALKFFPLINSTDGNNIELLRIFVNRAKKNELSFIPVQTHPRTDGPNSTGSSNPFERFHQENMAFRGNFCLILLINQKITNMVFSFV